MSTGGPARRHGDYDLAGVYYAIVTRNDDPEGKGRVRVRFPWLPNGEDQDVYWASCCVPMVGGSFGTHTLPEVEDTVFVMFLDGDVRRPIVMGGAYSKEDPPPEHNAGRSNDFRLIKSRSGHRVILDDSDKVKVVVSDYKNRNVVAVGQYDEGGVGRNKFKVPVPGPMTGARAVEGVAVSAMEGGAKLHVWCPSGTLSVQGKDVEISAKQTFDVKAQSISIQGKSTTVASKGPALYQGKPIKAGT